MNKTYTVNELKEFMIPTDKWGECPFFAAVEIAVEQSIDGFPAGIIHTPEDKWYVLGTGTGQELCILWSEGETDSAEQLRAEITGDVPEEIQAAVLRLEAVRQGRFAKGG